MITDHNEAFPLAVRSNTITGIDLSPHMIAVAMKNNFRNRTDNVTFFNMNAVDMNFRNQEFDITMNWFALHEMDYDVMLSVLHETSRVLKNGGRVYIVIMNTILTGYI